ncbi:hypothetical protein MNBD_NITROSPINAE04-74 [hydrothermal vent metagenome]|uniref:Uncharacterized protein n=1 Tax=hydrothermal vent metagenome TaxID=652676 RepID=A0A3B1CFP7_9ZZZZ
MKIWNISALVFLLLFLSMASLSGCGSGGGGDGSSSGSGSVATHSVPSWMIGSWQVIRLRLGDDVSSQNMILTVTETGFEYHYPGCDVHGTLSMDSQTPYYASNEYTLLMTFVDCPVSTWDIPSFEGATDEGHVWADTGASKFFRISDLYGQFTWVYIRL